MSNIAIPHSSDLQIFYHSHRKKAIIISFDCEKLKGEVNAMKEEKKEKIVSDPNGMYTGRPVDRDEKPIQDADDL